MKPNFYFQKLHLVSALLVYGPLFFLGASVLSDTLYLITDNHSFATFTKWTMMIGLLGALVGVPSALLDWLAMPPGSQASFFGRYNCVAKLGAVVLFALSWMMRSRDGLEVTTAAHILSYVAIAFAVMEIYFGGKLIHTPEMDSVEESKLDARGLLIDEAA